MPKFDDNQCDDSLNIWECNFDGGDCCRPVSYHFAGPHHDKCHLTGMQHPDWIEVYSSTNFTLGFNYRLNNLNCEDGYHKVGETRWPSGINDPQEYQIVKDYGLRWEVGYDYQDCIREYEDGVLDLWSDWYPEMIHIFANPGNECPQPETVGDGICDAVNNFNGTCQWDGGDCCLFLIDDSNCALDTCMCYQDLFVHASIHSSKYFWGQIGAESNFWR